MPVAKMLRFKDLKERGVASSWPHVKQLVHTYGFPPGYRLGGQTRAWREDEVEAWINSRRIPIDEVRL
jgi:predicted DNA-binding transcriptional regulator AlpA